MGLYTRYLLPRLTHCACASPALARLRGLIVPRASGTVLEIGFGSGLNLPWYDASRVQRLLALEPADGLRSLARERMRKEDRREHSFAVDVIDGVGEAIPLPDASVDSIVVTFTLCTVEDPSRTASEMRRVLRPGGSVFFAEHGAAVSERARRWQRRLEPAWTPLAGGCRLTRHPPDILRAAGFAVDWQEGLIGPPTSPWRAIDRLLHGYWGSAVTR
jgi:ubiquinone/menaquinone biosynthesis C-methylase UbiE